MTITNIEIQLLHPKVWLFKNAFKYSKEIIDFVINDKSRDWESWEKFGIQHALPVYELDFASFPSEEVWQSEEVDKINNKYVKEFVKVFYNTTKIFIETFNINKDDWLFRSTEVAKYVVEHGVSNEEAMSYHTDYEQDRHLEPGIKFGLACLVYLNEDYEGGEICFKIYNDDYSEILDEFEYKPKTGDVLVFPSEHPFYHSVKSIKSGSKYLIRHWWRHSYNGDQTYWDEKNNFLLKNSEQEWEKYLEKRRDQKRKEIHNLVTYGKNNES